MKISINPYGNVVAVDHEVHTVAKNLQSMFPGVASIHYDHESGIGHVEYLPTPPHTFYGMDGLKGLSDVLAAWNYEGNEHRRIHAERLAKLDADLAKVKADKDATKEEIETHQRVRDEWAAKAPDRTPESVDAQRKRDADEAQQSVKRAPVVVEDF